ncbi:autotransporter assembly complex protein TamA [Bartonella bacilliformis]|uniref:autotransporter assembly complex protein TamA n=1 Tax=Bartonella bacilliformis TaxID=774 RepID=UPI00044581EE|nr:autotransporter assembly complex family protein [Bartonella bacilliformis]EYS95596.1 hypothetical protein X470_00185 [Bartonella bacilliformis Peru-18]KEG16077.1 hypothetical protein H709_01195 [Bartonella bacilliformis CUSCO5]
MICQAKVLLQSGILRTACLGLCLVFSFPQPLAAFEIFGIHLFGEKKSNAPSDGIQGAQKSYKVDVVAPPGAPLEGVKIVKTVSSLVADQDKSVSSSAGLLAKARSNYREILSALYADGRYGGVISIKINGLEVADVFPMTELPDKSTIVITVDAGPQYVFNAVRINKASPLAKYKTGGMISVEDLGYKVGALAKSETILNAERWAIEGWRQRGYAKADVISRDIVADHARRIIDAQIVVDPKQKAYYGSINVRDVNKHPHIDPMYVVWMTGLKPGQQYDSEAVAKANKRLARLDVFRSIDVREADTINSDGHLPLTVVVEERKLRRLGMGGSYSTLDGSGGEIYWTHSNLFGHAERFKIETKINSIGRRKEQSYHPKNFDYLLGVTFIKPGIITPDTDLGAELKVQRDVLDSYITTAIKGKLSLTHVINDNLSGRVAMVITRGHLHDNHLGNRNFTVIGLQSDLIYDSRNNKLNATKGLYSEVILNPFYEMNLSSFMTKMTVEGRSYWVLDTKNRFVFATRAKLGTIIGNNKILLPPDVLFFSGGGGSVRGYAYHNIGIKTENGIIGGRSLIEGSAELRFSLNDDIGLVSFVDGGRVEEKANFGFLQKIKWGMGIGGRYMTGLGPVRFDVAWPLKREKGDPRIGIYVGIGQAF